MHRFDLAVVRRQALQRTDTQERFVVPNGPEGNLRRLQLRDIEGMRAARSRLRAGGSKVDTQLDR
jgi:hypothetical protein